MSNEEDKASKRTLQDSVPNHEYRTTRLVRSGGGYILKDDYALRNDLLLLVGFLEFFNCMDWPANTFQRVPVPIFAAVLMGIFGSIALSATIPAYIDFRRSWRNVRLLRQERRYLLQRQAKSPTAHGQAWLDLNFRELGWELVDRALMDMIPGFALILVGTGTLMAIGGGNPRVFLASNLLSGYIGNGFVALYALVNGAWSSYLFLRAQSHKRIILTTVDDEEVKWRAKTTFRRHQIYATVNGISLLVSGAGSLITATRPWGYYLLIPCVMASVFCNIFWRKRIGFHRHFVMYRSSAFEFDIYRDLQETLLLQNDKVRHEILQGLMDSSARILQFISRYEMFQDIAIYVANDGSLRQKVCEKGSNDIEITASDMLVLDKRAVVSCIGALLQQDDKKFLVDRERMLYELLAAYWRASTMSLVEVASEPKTALREDSAEADLEKANG